MSRFPGCEEAEPAQARAGIFSSLRLCLASAKIRAISGGRPISRYFNSIHRFRHKSLFILIRDNLATFVAPMWYPATQKYFKSVVRRDKRWSHNTEKNALKVPLIIYKPDMFQQA